jgi:hypothetical protein
MSEMVQDRLERMLANLEWWDADLIVSAAQMWRAQYSSAVRRIRVGQWQALLNAARQATDYASWRQALNGFFHGDGRKSEPGAHVRRQMGAVERDRGGSGWDQPDLVPALLAAIEQAASAQGGARAMAFESQIASLSVAAQSRLRDWRSNRQAALFLDALVSDIRVKEAQEGSKR